MKKFFLLIIPIIIGFALQAQGDMPAGNNNVMTGNHKIFVVVAVLAIILSALFIFLFSIERRLRKLEDTPTANR